jgi:hypothetical protein
VDVLLEGHSNSRTARRTAAEGRALRASLTSNGLQAPLRQDNQGETTPDCVSYVLSQEIGSSVSWLAAKLIAGSGQALAIL